MVRQVLDLQKKLGAVCVLFSLLMHDCDRNGTQPSPVQPAVPVPFFVNMRLSH